MTAFQRAQVAALVDRLAEPPRHIITLFGPRQSGKTTIARQALRTIEQPSRYRTVDEPDSAPRARAPRAESGRTSAQPPPKDTAWLVREWEAARREAAGSRRGAVLVLDEIQKIPQWSQTVKGLWDADRWENRPLHAVVLGSSPLRMQSGLTESLAGRFIPIQVTHWSFSEMAEAFGIDLPSYLYFGGYPGAASMVRNQALWRDHILQALIAPNIERDVTAMTRVDKPALLRQLFELGASYSGQILSNTKLLGQLQDAGNTTTLARYLDLLQDAGLMAGLPNYASRPHRRGSSPKLSVLNTALMTAGSGYSFEEAKADRTFWGRIVESAVGAHLFNTATSDTHLYYWRDGQREVDFVPQRGPRLVAIEVGTRGGRQGSLSGLAEFETHFKCQRSLLVGTGGVPLNEFLSVSAGHWFGSE